MWGFTLVLSLAAYGGVESAIRAGSAMNLLVDLKPVGGRRAFMPIKDLPPPHPSRRSNGGPAAFTPSAFIAKLAAQAKKPVERVAEPPTPIDASGITIETRENAATVKPAAETVVSELPLLSGRRHLDENCIPDDNNGQVDVFVDYFNIETGKDMSTVVWPDHVDHIFYEVTEPDLYYTVGTIHGIGYHPTTPSSDQPDECERIYEEFMEEQYDSFDTSEESTEHVVITTETDLPPDIVTTTDPCIKYTTPSSGEVTDRNFFDEVK